MTEKQAWSKYGMLNGVKEFNNLATRLKKYRTKMQRLNMKIDALCSILLNSERK